MPGHRIFIIIENPKDRMEYVRFFEELGFLVDTTPDGTHAIPHLVENRPAFAIADVDTPDFSAKTFLETIQENNIPCHTVFVSNEPVVEHAVNLMKLGALDYLIKPVPLEVLELTLKRAQNLAQKETTIVQPPVKKSKKVKIITRDKGMETLLSLVNRVADSSASILIQGESGTGKELFARHIHEKSDRNGQPFIAVNCAALPENLLESELFGHEKGSFTGAIARKTGKFELADKGTLFLDEITEMQFHLQAKLLRVLQEKVVDRVGGTEPVEVDVRVIATTNRDAKEAVEKKAFREDLFYRLNTIPVVIPPLRERSNDVETLTHYFVKKYCKIDRRNVKGLTSQALSILNRHRFSGNVRELENIIHRAVLLAESDLIEPKDLLINQSELTQVAQAPSSVDSPMDTEPSSLKEMEEKMIFKTLDQTAGNRTHAAKILGISVRTLRNKLNEYKEKN
jgi:DNA-binding NtrC family response regulator